jgi:L-ascorbate metabolism protein UlaG (beta-lactamase superfamily)
MKITFYGQNSLAIEVSGKHIIIDPFISGNPLSKDKVDINALQADYILLTHAHMDHVLDAEAIAINTGAVIVSNYEIAMHYQDKGIEVHPMNHGGGWQFDFGHLKYVSAIHSSTFDDGTDGGFPGGFVIEGEHKNVYIAGDTALTMDMKLIPMRTKLDLAILPIGDNFTMGIDDAVKAVEFLKPVKVIPMHYKTFDVIDVDPDEFVSRVKSLGVDAQIMAYGESLHY